MAEQLDDLTIRFPARSGYLAISRLNTTAMASAGGFDVDELDDLRLAVDEAVNWLLVDHDDQGDVIELAISCRGGRLDFRGNLSSNGAEAPALGDLVHAILGATVDSYETGLDDGGRRYISLAKQAAQTAQSAKDG